MEEAQSPNKDVATSKRSLGQLILIVAFYTLLEHELALMADQLAPRDVPSSRPLRGFTHISISAAQKLRVISQRHLYEDSAVE